MAENISNYLEEALLNHVFRNVPLTSPSAVYLGIVSDAATDAELEAGTLTNEITGYTGNRPAITFGAPTQVGGKGTIANTAVIEFLSMPAPSGRQVKYAIVCNAATGGNILYWCPLSVQKLFNAGDTFKVNADNLTLDLG